MAADPRARGFVDHLRREVDGTTAAVLWQSLYADCLRVVYTAVAADGVISDDEVAALHEFVSSIARHYAGAHASYRELAAVDELSVRSFFERYAADNGPFGERATLHWPGLTLCRRATEYDPEPLERYERMMNWLIPAACEIGNVTEGDARWGSRVAELHALRRTLATTAAAAATARPAVDHRLQAFLAPSGVFAAIQHASSVFEADPFDVEAIHQDARTSFEQMVERAVNLEAHGQMLLVLGDSGAGKTHLLRGLRRHVHEYGRGFVAYAQLNSAADDYARYLLQHVVDSLSRPYAGPTGDQTGLVVLASGLSRLVEDPQRTEILQLAEGDWDTPESLRDYVNRLVYELLQHTSLSRFDPDLLRVLLYALHPDPRTTAPAYKYLRCEDMNPHDRLWLGDVVPRTAREHPLQMIHEIARLAYVTRKATLVLMIDQAELSGYDAATGAMMFQRAINTLYSVVSEVPSAVAVVACLSDLYWGVRNKFTKGMIDRLEQNPPVETLRDRRSYVEIEAIVGRRLAWLFAQTSAVYKPEEPVYPIPPAALHNLVNRQTRGVLQWCHQFQTACAAAKKIVDPSNFGISDAESDDSQDGDLNLIAAAWNDACHAASIEVPDGDDDILAVVEASAKAVAQEMGFSLTMTPRKNGVLRVKLGGAKDSSELTIGVTNRSYHRGAFSGQIDALRRTAGETTPVAVRTVEFPRGAASEKVVAQLLKAGGRRAYVDGSTLRALVAFQNFRPPFPEARLTAWLRRDRPLTTLAPMVELFDLERLQGAQIKAAVSEQPASTRTRTPESGVPIVPAGGARATA
ncbi:MAG TPA: ATP-binding protein, partial [Kofleriaceae bacterium]